MINIKPTLFMLLNDLYLKVKQFMNDFFTRKMSLYLIEGKL